MPPPPTRQKPVARRRRKGGRWATPLARQTIPIVRAFLTEHCDRDDHLAIRATVLHKALRSWQLTAPPPLNYPITDTATGRALAALGIERRRHGNGSWYHSIGLKPAALACLDPHDRATGTLPAPPKARVGIVQNFIDDACRRTDTPTTQAADLFASYITWTLRRNSPPAAPLTATAFGRALRELGVPKTRRKTGSFYTLIPER